MALVAKSKSEYLNNEELVRFYENKILYDMCFKNASHKREFTNSGKIISIGRIYSANPSRGAGKPKRSLHKVRLYDHLGKALTSSNLDNELKRIDFSKPFSLSKLDNVIKVHDMFVEVIFEATCAWSQNPRSKVRRQTSFASKYLHFHRPNMFPLMDSLAKGGLKLNSGVQYQKFCEAILQYAKNSKKDFTLRELDTELLS